MADFKVGDIVILKSGSQPMTVEESIGDKVFCVWSHSKKIEKKSFSAGALKSVNDPCVCPTAKRAGYSGSVCFEVEAGRGQEDDAPE